MINNKFVPGSKYFRYIDNDNFEIIRINRKKGNEYSVICQDGSYKKLTEEYIKDNYSLLTPDGYVTFIIATMGETKDILVIFHRKEDIKSEAAVPYAVCRQFMDDVFTNIVLENKGYDNKGNKLYSAIGISVSQDTCPPDIDFRMTMLCDSIERQFIMATYVDDKLDDILSFIHTKPYDNILEKIYNINSKNKFLIGSCKSVKELLEVNNFMYDIYSGYNIYQIPFSIDPEFSGSFTNIDIVDHIQNIVRSNIINTYVTKFTKEINLREIKKDFILIADKNENIFIVAYDKSEDFDMSYESINYKLKMSKEKMDSYNIF